MSESDGNLQAHRKSDSENTPAQCQIRLADYNNNQSLHIINGAVNKSA